MHEVAAKQRQIMVRAGAMALILAGLAALSGRWPVALGVLAGCFFGLLNFQLLALGIIKLLELKDPRAARVQAVLRYIVRYAITIAVLYTISTMPSIDLFAAALGFLLIKVVILSEAIFSYIKQLVQSFLNPAWWERREK